MYLVPLMKKRNNKGLSLVELLVAIVIILILVALVSSVIISVKERGKVSVDVSNLRQIGLAAAIYASDYDDIHPLSVRTLITEGRITEKICVSPSDTTEKGLMWHFIQNLSEARKHIQEPIPRSSYIGPGDGLWTWNSFLNKVYDKENAGWLVNWVRANVSETVVSPTGPYQRLLMDTSVKFRYMGYQTMFIEGKLESKVVVFGEYFCDNYAR